MDVVSSFSMKCFKAYNAPSKESTFSETLILAVKSSFSHSNHHKSSMTALEVSQLDNREVIEVEDKNYRI